MLPAFYNGSFVIFLSYSCLPFITLVLFIIAQAHFYNLFSLPSFVCLFLKMNDILHLSLCRQPEEDILDGPAEMHEGKKNILATSNRKETMKLLQKLPPGEDIHIHVS